MIIREFVILVASNRDKMLTELWFAALVAANYYHWTDEWMEREEKQSAAASQLCSAAIFACLMMWFIKGEGA